MIAMMSWLSSSKITLFVKDTQELVYHEDEFYTTSILWDGEHGEAASYGAKYYFFFGAHRIDIAPEHSKRAGGCFTKFELLAAYLDVPSRLCCFQNRTRLIESLCSRIMQKKAVQQKDAAVIRGRKEEKIMEAVEIMDTTGDCD